MCYFYEKTRKMVHQNVMRRKIFDAKSIEIDLTGEHFLQTKLVGISNDLKLQPRDF